MGWEDSAPTSQELQTAGPGSPGGSISWDSTPPSASETSHPSWLDASIPGGTPRGYIHGISDTLPYVGAAGGTGLGLVGAGLGYAAGSAAKKIINTLVDEGPSSVKAPTLKGTEEAFKSVPSDVVTGMGYETGGRLLGAGLSATANTPLAKYIAKKAGSVASTLGSTLTGMTKGELETYASNPAEINAIAKEAGYNSQALADNLRSEINSGVQSAKKELYGQLSKSFDARAGQTIDSKPIIDQIEASKANINAKLRAPEIAQVDEMIQQVKSLTDGNGQLSLRDAHDLKELLQEQAEGSYSKNGQIFQNGTKAQMAAKHGAATARNLLYKAAPEVGEVNGTLKRLHDAEDVMNKSMLQEGKSGASLFSAGSGANETNAAALEELGNITGKDFLGAAKKISAAKAFGKPPILPVDSTGKATTRMGAAALAAYELGGAPAVAAIEALASPLGTKGIINAGSLGSKVTQGVMSGAPSAVGAATTGLANKFSSQNVGQDNNPPGYSEGGTVYPSDSYQVAQAPNSDPKTKVYIDPQKAKEAQDSMRKAFHFAEGGMVPGTPQVPGNSPQNDTVLGKLTPGETVLPLSVTQSSNPPQSAKEFMANEMMKQQPQPMQQQGPQAPAPTAKGMTKWANDGLQNLKQHVADLDRQWLDKNKTVLLVDPKAQNLLITASSFSPGAKPLDDIIKHLKKRMGNK